MKKNKKNHLFLIKLDLKITLTIILLFSVFSVIQAQEVVLSSGGNITGSGGSANYSVGQIVQNTTTGTNGSAIQGIQFYFEDSVLSIVDLETNLSITTYPNPTASILNIKIQNETNSKLSYNVFNLLGKLIISGKIINNSTTIDIEHLPIATYLLKVSDENNIIKTYKIIKN